MPDPLSPKPPAKRADPPQRTNWIGLRLARDPLGEAK
jgi:hypothetical protein